MSDRARLIQGDALDVLRGLPDASVDALVTDPPSGIGFMGQAWDSDRGGRDAWVGWLAAILRECRRVLKPGAHAFVWALPRTSHWTALALEEAGFEIRDSVSHLFSTGFPKSLDVAKAIDRRRHDREDVLLVTAWIASERDRAGLTNAAIDAAFGFNGMAGRWTSLREQPSVPTLDQVPKLLDVLGVAEPPEEIRALLVDLNGRKGEPGPAWAQRPVVGGATVPDACEVRPGFAGQVHPGPAGAASPRRTVPITTPATPDALRWEGWGTALAPSHEVWWLARKPLDGTVAANVLAHGTGALNVAGCRVGDERREEALTDLGPAHGNRLGAPETWGQRLPVGTRSCVGRWPKNTVLSHAPGCGGACAKGCPVAELDRQSGGAAPFFPTFLYAAKPSRSEREKGCEILPLRSAKKLNEGGIQARRDAQAERAIADAEVHSQGLDARGRTLVREDGTKTLVDRFVPQYRANTHTTVKATDLMAWLCRMITPPGGVVLDPFMGSGSTGVAALREGFSFVGIEPEPAYFEIAEARIDADVRGTLFEGPASLGSCPAAPVPAAQGDLFGGLSP